MSVAVEIARDELATVLRERCIVGPVSVQLEVESDPRLRLLHPDTKQRNPFRGAVRVSDLRVRLGVNYEAEVNAARIAAGRPADFKSGSRVWGDDAGIPFLEHKDRLYLQVFVDELLSTRIECEGHDVTEVAEPWTPVRDAPGRLAMKNYRWSGVRLLTIMDDPPTLYRPVDRAPKSTSVRSRP